MIYDPWRSILTAASLLIVLWQLAKINLLATALVVVGIGVLALGLFLNNLLTLSILVISVGLIASGKSFAHWQYQPGHKMQMLATGMALVGFSGVALVREKLWRGRRPFGLNNANVFYSNFALLFLVLPVAYGGMSALLNVVMWLCYFALAGAYLYRSNSRISVPGKRVQRNPV